MCCYRDDRIVPIYHAAIILTSGHKNFEREYACIKKVLQLAVNHYWVLPEVNIIENGWMGALRTILK